MKEGSMDNKPTMKNRIIKYTESKRQKKKNYLEQIEKLKQTDTLNHINSIKCNCSKTAMYMERVSHWTKKLRIHSLLISTYT